MRSTHIFRIHLLIALAVIGFTSCKQQPGAPKKIFIDIKRDDQVSTKDIFSKISLVPLETSKDLLIKRADKILCSNNKYFLLDVSGSQIVVFNETGKFLFKIQRQTNSLGRYERFRDMEINRFDGNIELLTPAGTLYVYSQQGKYLNTINPRGMSAKQFFADINRDTVVFYSMFDAKRLTFYSRKAEKILGDAFEVPQFITRRTGLNLSSSPFRITKNAVRISPVFTNVTYDITGDELVGDYAWDFGKYNFTIDTLNPNKLPAYYRAILTNPNFVYYFYYNTESQNKIFASFEFQDKTKNLIFNKADNSYKLFSRFREGGVYPPKLMAFDKGVYASADPSKLSQAIVPSMLDEWEKKKLQSIKLTDNPVIIKYYF